MYAVIKITKKELEDYITARLKSIGVTDEALEDTNCLDQVDMLVWAAQEEER